MGMYTRLELDVLLRKDTPEPAIHILHIMCRPSLDGIDMKQAAIGSICLIHPGLDHPVFETWRASWMFRCDGGLGDTEIPYFVRNEDGTYVLRLRFSVKNYERSINLFLDWLSQFLIPYGDGSIRGMYVYEEDREESKVVVRGGKLTIVAPPPEEGRDGYKA